MFGHTLCFHVCLDYQSALYVFLDDAPVTSIDVASCGVRRI